MKFYNRGDESIEYNEITIAPLSYNEYTTLKNYFGLGGMFYYAF